MRLSSRFLALGLVAAAVGGVARAQEDEVQQTDGPSQYGIVLDSTDQAVTFQRGESAPATRIPRGSIAGLTYSVPMQELERLDVRKAPEGYFDLGLRWLRDFTGKAQRYQARKVLWLAIRENPQKFYEKGLLAMLDAAGSDAERWSLLRTGLYAYPENQEFKRQMEGLRAKGPAGNASLRTTRDNLAKNLKLFISGEYAGLKEMLAGRDSGTDPQTLKAMRLYAKLDPSDLLSRIPRPTDACGLCRNTGNMRCNTCGGTRVGYKPCTRCGGKGYVKTDRHYYSSYYYYGYYRYGCPRCNGKGTVVEALQEKPCPTCTDPCPGGCRQGKVESPCTACNGTGQVPCTNPKCPLKNPGGDAPKVTLQDKEKEDLSAFLAVMEADPAGLGERSRLAFPSAYPTDLDFTRPYFRGQRWTAVAR